MPIAITNPYNIARINEREATIDFYGEVVQTRPVDWLGRPIPGNFIAVDEFLADLEQLGDVDRITVHINSVGGDMYGGIAIYNRLRGLAAEVVTVNDGLAASAGSIIFEAGNVRRVNAGSNIMIHGARGFIFGYYNESDLKAAAKQLAAHNKAAINLYAERTGLDTDEVKALVDAETWYTGEEAVEAGFADEVISEDEATELVEMKLSPDRSRLMVGGMAVAAALLGNIPERIPQMTAEEWAQISAPAGGTEPHNNSMHPAQQGGINTNLNGGSENMEIRNSEDLRAAYPELVAEIESTARAAGAAAERNRLSEIESIRAGISDAELLRGAMFGEQPMSAAELALAAMRASATTGASASTLAALHADAAGSGAAGVQTAPTVVETPKNETEKSAELLISAIPVHLKKKED